MVAMECGFAGAGFINSLPKGGYPVLPLSDQEMSEAPGQNISRITTILLQYKLVVFQSDNFRGIP
jgi:hypothetical protein